MTVVQRPVRSGNRSPCPRVALTLGVCHTVAKRLEGVARALRYRPLRQSESRPPSREGATIVKSLVPVVAAAVVFSLAGCSGDPSAGPVGPESGSNRAPSTSAPATATQGPAPTGAAAVPAPVPVPTLVQPADDKIGSTHKWQNGVSVAVGEPTVYEPSSSATGTEPGKTYVVITFAISNGSDKVYDSAEFRVSVQSGDTEAAQVYDSAKGVVDAPSTQLLVGQETKFSLAFAVPDPAALVVLVAPGFDYQGVVFTS